MPLAAGLVLAAAGVAAYHGTFGVPYLLDDDGAVLENPALDLSHPWQVLFPPVAATTAARPLLNLSFAIQHAVHGTSVWGYHAVNLAIHVVAALALYGVLRRVFGALPPSPSLWRAGNAQHRTPNTEHPIELADWMGLGAAAIWMLHPIQTEAVTYISQRAESMAAMFVLVALWSFLRATAQRPTPNTQHPTPKYFGNKGLLFSGLACAAGLLTKETAVVGPVLVLMLDRVLVAGSFREALRARRGFYLGLAGCWVLAAGLFLSAPTAGRGVAVGTGFFSLSYLATQVGVIAHYLRLIFWPAGLVFDYGPTDPPGAMPFGVAMAIVAAAIVGVIGLWRRFPMAALAASAFLIALAPSSSVVPLTFQPAAENRVYLALAAVVAAMAWGVARPFQRRQSASGRPTLPIILLSVIAIVLGVATERRNSVYRDEETLWTDTAVKRPQNWRAHYNLALLLGAKPGREGEAIARYELALQANPELPEAHNNIGALLMEQPGRGAEAIAHYETALRMKPDFAEAHLNLADGLMPNPARRAEALAHYEAALAAKPGSATARIRYGNALLADPARARESIPLYEAALKLDPDSIEARVNVAAAYFQSGRVDDAIAALEEVVKRDPQYAQARDNLARLRAMKK